MKQVKYLKKIKIIQVKKEKKKELIILILLKKIFLFKIKYLKKMRIEIFKVIHILKVLQQAKELVQ